jgi:hypothetical protein
VMSGCVLIHVLKWDVSARCMRSETGNRRHERVILSLPGSLVGRNRVACTAPRAGNRCDLTILIPAATICSSSGARRTRQEPAAHGE